MKKRYLLSIILLATLLGAFTSCEKFLDTLPDDRAQLNTLNDIKQMLTSGYPGYSYVPIFELRSDNMSDKGYRTGSASPTFREMYEWRETVQSSYQDSPQGYWRDAYNGVSAANHALELLSKVDVLPSEKQKYNEIKGEALLLRAYHIYMLAQAFTIPYDPATAATALGVPYPTEPENELIKEYKRGTLKETYEQIERDLEEGIKLVGSTYEQAKYHFTPASAAAFATRFYRTVGNWDKVIEYGKTALGTSPELLLRKVNTKYVGFTYAERMATWGSNNEDCNLLCVIATSTWARAGNFVGRYGIDIRLRDGIRNADGAPKNFLGKNPAFQFYGRELYANVPKIKEYFEVTNVATGTGFVNSEFVLFSAEEVLFNMAEAYVMKEQFAEAERLLQMYVSRWVENYKEGDPAFAVTKEKIVNYYTGKTGKVTPDPIFGKDITTFNPFYTTTEVQEMYIRAILYWRRATFIHEGLRWLDNRQYRMDIIHNVLSNSDSQEDLLVLRGDSDHYPYQLPTNVLTYLPKNPGYDTPIEKLPN